MKFHNKEIQLNGLKGVLIENPSIIEAKDIWEEASTEIDNVFLSWVWIGPWVNLIKDNFDINLFVVYKDDEIIAAVFLMLNRQSKHGFIRKNKLYLNEICAESYNMIIEYNGIAVKSGYEKNVFHLFSKYLLDEKVWDKLILNAIEYSKFNYIKQHIDLNVEVLNQGMSRQALLTNQPYDCSDSLKKTLLSSNKRCQINRSKRYIENLYGKITLSLAETKDQALQYFDELGELHTKYWQNKGLPGSFKNYNWVSFNKKIIMDGIEHNHVQLIKIQSNEFIIGYLYNLVYKKKIYNIQSGFQYLEDNKFRPGLLSHWLAIEYSWQKGYEVYDFLAGGEEYKKSFSNSETELIWVVFNKPTLLFFIEKYSKKILQYYKRLTEKFYK